MAVDEPPHNGHRRQRVARSSAHGGKPLPHNDDVEASLLGGILLRPTVLSSLGTLEIDDFYDHKHRVVFEAMRNLEHRGDPIDITTLEADIERQGKLDAVGGIALLSELALRVASVDNVIAYAKIVRDKSLLRRLALKVSHALERVGTWEYEADELLGETIADLQQLDRGYREASEQIPLISVGAALEQLAALSRTPIYPTPFPELNAAIGFGGALGGQVYTVVSGTGAGKTSWVSTIAQHHSARDVESLVATWEMIPGYFVARMAAPHLRVNSNSIIRGDVSFGEVQRAVPQRINFLHRPSMAMLRRAIDRAMRGGRPAPLVVIDYIQALAEIEAQAMQRPDPRQANALVSRQLVQIAQETGAPMFVVSATSRFTSKKLAADVRKLPPRDLVDAAKETSQIEYDGAALIVLSVSDEQDLDGQIATMTVAKSRFGETCHLDARVDGARGGWRELGRVRMVPKVDGTVTNASAVREAIVRVLRSSGPQASKTKLQRMTGRNKTAVFSEIDAMVDSGAIVFAAGKMTLPDMVIAAPTPPVQGPLAGLIAEATR